MDRICQKCIHKMWAHVYLRFTIFPKQKMAVHCSEGIWLSGKTLDCRPRDCEFDPPSLQLKLLKGDMYWFFPGKMLPCISALHWAR